MKELFSILQLAGGTFPAGAFSQSWGLETYIYDRTVRDEEAFRGFLRTYTDVVLGGLEGPFFCEAYTLADKGQLYQLPELDELFAAMRLTKETREAAFRTGKALLRIVSEMVSDEAVAAYYGEQKSAGISFPIAFALAAQRMGAPRDEALSAFIFSSVNAMIQSALKLIPLGNMQAQRILRDFYPDMEAAKKKALATPAEEASAFCPGLDIASARHETLPTRLYMS